MQPARVSLGGDAAVLGEHHLGALDLSIARAWVKVRGCLCAKDLDLKANVEAPWALLLGGGYWLPVLHFRSEIWAAYMEAEGGEGAWRDAVLHSPLEPSGLWMSSGDQLSKEVSMSQKPAWDAFVGTKAPWRERRSTVWTQSQKKKRQSSGQQRGRRGSCALASTVLRRARRLAMMQAWM